ncbi:MAG: histidine phosphatase family protein [Micropruina sp.]|uniref:SixA phosphatase family protein n=1 Tax=Micropruina sp. TaxID=2737536 RepID=UPI0039E49025
MSHTLIVMRHAKSSWSTNDPDHGRPLAERGIRDAGAAGRILAEYPIGALLSSSSTRTRQTWQNAAASGAHADQVTFTDALYGAWAESVADLLHELDESVGTAMVLGHEPTMSSLVEWLAEPSELRDEASAHYPTSALAVLEFDCGWAEVGAGRGRVVRFEIPRG